MMAALEELELSNRTAIFFTSDNGGLILGNPPVTDNSPLRSGKGSAYEGGVRVPLIVRWPDAVARGSHCEEPVISVDFLPTIHEMADVGTALPGSVDGLSLMPLLTNRNTFERDAVFWHYPHYHPGGATPYSAIRAEDFRLVQYYEDGKIELYNLRDDIGETNDLSESLPDKARELTARLDTWRRSVNAQMPLPNRDWDGR
jgi:arylsulfatase A-like enzyme